MNETKSLASAIHDAIDSVTSSVEEINRSVADVPLEILGGIAPLHDAVAEVRRVQSQSIGAVYDLVREVNDRVRELTTGDDER